MAADEHLGPQFVDIYHATEHDIAKSIKKQGFLHRPGAGTEDDPEPNYTFADRFGAEEYGSAALDDGEGYSMVHMRIPHHEVDKYLHPPLTETDDQGNPTRVWAARRDIPKNYLHKVERIKSEWDD